MDETSIGNINMFMKTGDTHAQRLDETNEIRQVNNGSFTMFVLDVC